MSESALGAELAVIDLSPNRSSDHPIREIGGAMAFEVVPTAAGRLHSDQYTKIIIINTPINLSFPLIVLSSPTYCTVCLCRGRTAGMASAKLRDLKSKYCFCAHEHEMMKYSCQHCDIFGSKFRSLRYCIAWANKIPVD